jgi:hypothetical protein
VCGHNALLTKAIGCPSCSSTPTMPTANASFSIVNGLEKLGSTNTDVLMSARFRIWNTLSLGEERRMHITDLNHTTGQHICNLLLNLWIDWVFFN